MKFFSTRESKVTFDKSPGHERPIPLPCRACHNLSGDAADLDELVGQAELRDVFEKVAFVIWYFLGAMGHDGLVPT